MRTEQIRIFRMFSVRSFFRCFWRAVVGVVAGAAAETSPQLDVIPRRLVGAGVAQRRFAQLREAYAGERIG